jgi:hypothetical protein
LAGETLAGELASLGEAREFQLARNFHPQQYLRKPEDKVLKFFREESR